MTYARYHQLDIVYTGQGVEVLGSDESGAYYSMRAPNGQVCWLWSHYATLNGGQDSPVRITPPPSPQADDPDSPWDMNNLQTNSNCSGII